MAFDLNRALSLGRRAARLLGVRGGDTRSDPRAAGGRADAGTTRGGARFPGPPGPAGPAWDPTQPTDSWPMPGPGEERRPRQTHGSGGGDRPAAAPAPTSGSATDPRGRALLPDFTGPVRIQYAPVPGPVAGPGEVVWTWVPYQEMDGRGKDRPVLLIGRDGDHLLGLMLTTRDRNNTWSRDDHYVDVGAGAWDRTGRASEAKLDRVLRVDPTAVRREGGVLERAAFDRVGVALARAQVRRR